MNNKLLTSVCCATLLAGASMMAIAKDGLTAVPYKVTANDNAKGSIVVKKDKVKISALKGTDLYTNSTGSESADNTPRVLFEPKGDFIFSAKVTTAFNKPYDGGALIVYADGKHWGKLLFERFKSGDAGVASTVTRGGGDDAYHGSREDDGSLYLKIVRHKQSFIFYTSPNGTKWNFIRNFGLIVESGVKVGFSAQAPLSDKLDVTFSDIRFESKSITNYWQGE